MRGKEGGVWCFWTGRVWVGVCDAGIWGVLWGFFGEGVLGERQVRKKRRGVGSGENGGGGHGDDGVRNFRIAQGVNVAMVGR